MKKIVLLISIALLATTCLTAQALSLDSLGGLFKHQSAKKEKLAPKAPASSDDSMTTSEKAVLYYSENNLKNALDTLVSIKEDDRTVQDWVLLGNILQDQDKVSDASFMYQRAIVVDPKNYKAYYNLANIYLAEEKPNLAIENYTKAYKVNDKFPYTYYNLGCAYLKLGNLKKAKIAFLKAIEIKNTAPEFHYNLAYTYKMLNKPKLAKQYLSNYNKLMENSAQ